jgi:hypothetical protein
LLISLETTHSCRCINVAGDPEGLVGLGGHPLDWLTYCSTWFHPVEASLYFLTSWQGRNQQWKTARSKEQVLLIHLLTSYLTEYRYVQRKSHGLVQCQKMVGDTTGSWVKGGVIH